MRRTLKLHPDSNCQAVTGIEVEARRLDHGGLGLIYRATGRMSELRLPSRAAPERADELWRHTCFEAFVRAPGSAGYGELNVAPSGQWAAYRFAGHRDGMVLASEVQAPRIEVRLNDTRLELDVTVDIGALAGDGPWRIGLSAVIEETDGRISYWALEHPPGKADFHHADCFALEVREPGRP